MLASCIVYLLAQAYTLTLFSWDMPLWRYLLGMLLLLIMIPFVFAPNRAYFSHQVEGSTHQEPLPAASLILMRRANLFTEYLAPQALLNSLLSVLASLGGVLGPFWYGISSGKPETSGPVAQATFIGCGGLVLLTFLVFGFTTSRSAVKH